MALIGKSTNDHLLTGILDPPSLVRLARDILFAQGHQTIQITDGPGDGGRDLHSVSPNGVPHLSQCKFHLNQKSACSSSEMGELPMSMVKLGYESGSFFTNARISPQAKREYLNGFPGLDLNFFDGDSLAAEVFTHTLLKAAWFDGEGVAKINVSNVFPVLARNHRSDTPIELCSDEDESWGPAADYLCTQYPRNRFALRRAMPSTEPFEPYRAPEPFTSKEGGLPFLFVAEVTVDGDLALGDLPDLSHHIAKALLRWLGCKYPNLSIRVGRPYVVPLAGMHSGARVETDLFPVTYIQTLHSCAEERAWFGVHSENPWSARCDARMSEVEWVRLYNTELNCLLSYEIRSRLAWKEAITRMAQREVLVRGWMNSIFCLMPASETWLETTIPEPDLKFDWHWDGRHLYGWLHWSLSGGFIFLRGSEGETDFLQLPSDDEEHTRLALIQERLAEKDHTELIEPVKARHMVAVLTNDPLPEVEFTIYGTAQVVADLKTLASPIQPCARSFELIVAWRSSIDAAEFLKVLTTEALRIAPGMFQSFNLECYKEFIVSRVDVTPADLEITPTDILLRDVDLHLSLVLKATEDVLTSLGCLLRATQEYWKERTGVHLGVSWYDTGKVHVVGIDDEGHAHPLDAQSFSAGGNDEETRHK